VAVSGVRRASRVKSAVLCMVLPVLV
jgi:hypothetical protein